MLAYAAYGIDEDTRRLIQRFDAQVDGLQRQISSQKESFDTQVDVLQRQISSQQQRLDAQDRKIGVLEQTCSVSNSYLRELHGSVQKRCK